MKGLLCAESLNLDLVNIQVIGCWYKQTHVRVAMFTTVRITVAFLGGPESILFSLFQNKKASLKGIYTLNGVHI